MAARLRVLANRRRNAGPAVNVRADAARAAELEQLADELDRRAERNVMTKNTNPFWAGTYNGHDVYTVTTDDRVQKVKGFSREQCEAALQVKGLQATVRRAVEVRIRKLDREARTS